MIQDLLAKAIADRKVGVRKAAKEMGIAHTTLYRMLNGEPVDMKSMEKAADWMGISLKTLLEATLSDSGAGEGKNTQALVAMVVERCPGLGELFEEIADGIAKGELTDDDLYVVAEFTAYRLKNSTRRSHERKDSERANTPVAEKGG
jgi:predicted DNA-binding protein (UPF0251 family)